MLRLPVRWLRSAATPMADASALCCNRWLSTSHSIDDAMEWDSRCFEYLVVMDKNWSRRIQVALLLHWYLNFAAFKKGNPSIQQPHEACSISMKIFTSMHISHAMIINASQKKILTNLSRQIHPYGDNRDYRRKLLHLSVMSFKMSRHNSETYHSRFPRRLLFRWSFSILFLFFGFLDALGSAPSSRNALSTFSAWSAFSRAAAARLRWFSRFSMFLQDAHPSSFFE